MKLSKAQIDVLSGNLSHAYGHVKLLCDGRKITLEVRRGKGLTYRVMTFVDGEFKGIWIGISKEAKEYPEQKFLRKQVHKACKPSFKAKMEKVLGKRHVAKDPYYSQTFTVYYPDWPSGKAALNHLNKVCESVQLLE